MINTNVYFIMPIFKYYIKLTIYICRLKNTELNNEYKIRNIMNKKLNPKILFLICWSPFILSRNLDEVFTYNHMALIFLRSHSHVKVSVIFMRANHLCIHNYIRSLLNIIFKTILMVRRGSNPCPTACGSDALAN